MTNGKCLLLALTLITSCVHGCFRSRSLKHQLARYRYDVELSLHLLHSWTQQDRHIQPRTGYNPGCQSNAAEGGHLDILMWLRESERECAWGNTCAKAAQAGHAEVLKWARENGCPWDEEICWCAAIREGHLNVLKWARENGYQWNEDTCSLAAEYGRLEVLKWARANDCPWNAETCSSAAWAPVGHLDVLKWAHQNGCPWDEHTCSCSLAHENWHILRWALAHGCPCYQQTYNYVARVGRMDILQYQSLDLAD
ncbi:expressed unknown protein [Seminavis robusta]|uniref:Ankyrin repeat-containing domain n=1 Tax=Seminavis robusta TaxID=568900 RepID=A0A9N8EI95_9STRA|nr:expressed unknown protein [Seminavis robusta]|eukprot:Sro1035_g233881.1  (254) ;mRNA; r:6707-7468